MRNLFYGGANDDLGRSGLDVSVAASDRSIAVEDNQAPLPRTEFYN